MKRWGGPGPRVLHQPVRPSWGGAPASHPYGRVVRYTQFCVFSKWRGVFVFLRLWQGCDFEDTFMSVWRGKVVVLIWSELPFVVKGGLMPSSFSGFNGIGCVTCAAVSTNLKVILHGCQLVITWSSFFPPHSWFLCPPWLQNGTKYSCFEFNSVELSPGWHPHVKYMSLLHGYSQ